MTRSSNKSVLKELNFTLNLSKLGVDKTAFNLLRLRTSVRDLSKIFKSVTAIFSELGLSSKRRSLALIFPSSLLLISLIRNFLACLEISLFCA